MILNVEQIKESLLMGLSYLPQTLLMMILPFLICMLLGLVIAVIRVWKVPVLSQIFQFIFAIMKGIPVLLLLIVLSLVLMMNFPAIAAAFGLDLKYGDVNPLVFAVLILVLAFLPGVSEMIRGGLLAVPYGQYEAGYAVGLTRLQTLRRIVLPQVLPEIMPAMTNMLISMLKASALAYSIGVTDVMNAAVRAASVSYNLLEGYIAAALIYWATAIILERLMALLAKRVSHFKKTLTI